MLLKLLETTYDVRGTVLDWFATCASCLSQSVIAGGVEAAYRLIGYGFCPRVPY